MNLLNVISITILGALIVFSIYFIKISAENKNKVEYPFFVSTRDDITNVRSGPSLDYPIILVYYNKMLPLKVLDTNNEWYQIEDSTGKTGWVYKNLTSQNKTAITLETLNVYMSSQINSKVVAIIKKNNNVKVIKCQEDVGRFCKIEITHPKMPKSKIIGWVLKTRLWGGIY